LSVVIGIDPGSRITGYGIVERKGSRIVYRGSGIIRVRAKDSKPLRLAAIKKHLDSVLGEFKPSAMAVENVFVARNPRSALTLGEARGIALLAAAEAEVEVFEYSPREVKGAVTGAGSAHKSQVSAMVLNLLRPDHDPASEDETDALAVAFCHASRMNTPVG
jgi:crossover junction endodeoxyribonuclease RuvC